MSASLKVIRIRDSDLKLKLCTSGPIKVTEHQLPEDEVIATFRAEDEDSGAFGQVVYSLAPGQADAVYTHFSVTTLRGEGVLKLKSELDFEFRHLYQV